MGGGFFACARGMQISEVHRDMQPRLPPPRTQPPAAPSLTCDGPRDGEDTAADSSLEDGWVGGSVGNSQRHEHKAICFNQSKFPRIAHNDVNVWGQANCMTLSYCTMLPSKYLTQSTRPSHHRLYAWLVRKVCGCIQSQ